MISREHLLPFSGSLVSFSFQLTEIDTKRSKSMYLDKHTQSRKRRGN